MTTAHSWMNHIKTSNYTLFNLRETISWRELEGNFFRTSIINHLDTLLKSKDQWRTFSLSVSVKNLNETTLITHFYDKNNLHFLTLNRSKSSVIWAHIENGELKILKSSSAPLHFESNDCRLKIGPDSMQFFINDQNIFDEKIDLLPAAFGFLHENTTVPITLFRNISINGILQNGLPISTQAPLKNNFITDRKFFILSFFLLFFLSLSLLSIQWVGKYWFLKNKLTTASVEKSFHINWKSASALFAATTAILFWPFLSKGDILISSYDNLGEIFPLFFYSKHVFMNWFHGISSGLWCSLAHNGMPYYTNHWNMTFNPLNWPIFFAPDAQVMHWLTFKTMIEIFLIGILAFGFFKRELKNNFWALICALSYQLGSLLIFTLNIFPTISLFFAMTLYLYIVWSIPDRRWIWNYILITLSIYLILVSANVAFVFYAILSLFIVTLYRIISQKSLRSQIMFPLIGGVINGFLIASIRLLPCLWGILNSNRLAPNYFSIHDRFPLIVRLFVPSIAGWLGEGQFCALGSKSFGWIFENVNPQSEFFVYYGIMIALLVTIGIAIPGDKKLRFWKFYAWFILLFALLWKPIWGVLSILFFPLNHYSYHTIMLPLALCGFAGHIGKAITEGQVPMKKIFKLIVIVLIVFGCYSLVFLTYLFPNITPYSRMLLLTTLSIGGLWALIKRYVPRYYKHFSYGLILAWFAFLTAMLFSCSPILISQKFLMKAWLNEYILWPTFSIFTILGLIGCWILKFSKENSRLIKNLCWVTAWILGTLLIMKILLPYVKLLANTDESLRIYIFDVINDHMKWMLLTTLFLLIGAFWHKKIFSRTMLATLVILLVAADLLTFNMRFDNIAAPFGHRKAFYSKSFQYTDIDEDTKNTLDLVNYRVALQHKAKLNANKNLIFDLPSYSGTMGYMPNRFAEFIHAFGAPKETILIYPIDHIDNKRFLDLSSIRYLFKSSTEVTIRESALPRLSIYYQYDVVSEKEVLLRALQNKRFKYDRNVLLSEDPAPKPLLKYSIKSKPIEISSSQSDKISATAHTQYAGIILFNESFDEGWKAFIDGKPSPIVPANHNFMATVIPAGSHKITFEYLPQKYLLAKAIHYLGLLIIVCVLGIWIFKKKKKINNVKK